MKQTILYFLGCLLLFSCSDSEFSGVEESQSFKNLESYYNQINDWNSISLKALDEVSIETIATYTSTSSENCEDPGTTTTTSASLSAGHGSALSLFAETLGYSNPMELNDWFIKFGKVYYDLIVEQRPENKTEFINYVSSLHFQNENACIQGCMNDLAVSAYNMGKDFGIRTNVGTSRVMTQNHIFGTESATFHVFTMLDTKKSCESK